MESYTLLKQLSEYSAVCGDEYELSDFIKELFQVFDYKIIQDKIGNIIVHIKGKESKTKLMIYTHFDEPGLVVEKAHGKNFIKFNIAGDIKAKDLASQEVYVNGEQKMLGLIGLRPPHILTEEERKAPVKKEELSIDIGMPSNAVSAGDTAVFKRDFMQLIGDMVSGKALCDRAGILVLFEVIKYINDLNFDVYIALGVQHYNNLIGAITVTNQIKPDIAIVIDSIEAKSRENDKLSSICGRGPVIYIGPTSHKKLTIDMIEFCRRNNLQYQVKASSGKNKTDAWAIQVGCGGVPVILIMNPIRYRHTSVEVMNTKDIKKASDLLIEYIKHLDCIDWGELLCY